MRGNCLQDEKEKSLRVLCLQSHFMKIIAAKLLRFGKKKHIFAAAI
jgi:hypothetical protein